MSLMSQIQTNKMFRSMFLATRLSLLRPTPKLIVSEVVGKNSQFFRNVMTNPRVSYDSPKVLQRFHNMDKIPMKKYILIYRSNFPTYLILTQLINLLVFLGLSFAVIVEAFARFNPPPSLEEQERIVQEKQRLLEERKKNEDPTNWAFARTINNWLQELDYKAEARKNEYMKSDTFQKYKIEPTEADKLPKPSLYELEEGGLESLLFFSFTMLVLIIAMVKVQRSLPIRIYTSENGHSIGIFYGHIIPSLMTKHEFVAGTLKRSVGSKITWSKNVFVDGSGRKMILFENMFRYPADFNYLMSNKDPYLDRLEDDDDDLRR